MEKSELWSCSHCADTEHGGCGEGEGHSRAAKTSKSSLGIAVPASSCGIEEKHLIFRFYLQLEALKIRLFDRKSRALVLLGGGSAVRDSHKDLCSSLPCSSRHSQVFILCFFSECLTRPVRWGVMVAPGVTNKCQNLANDKNCHRPGQPWQRSCLALGALCHSWESHSRELLEFLVQFVGIRLGKSRVSGPVSCLAGNSAVGE